MARPTKYDWDAIRIQFVEGLLSETGETHYPTLRDLAGLHECNYDHLRTVAADQRWNDEKTAWLAAIQRQRREAKLRELSKVGVEFDSEALDDARVGLRLIGAQLGRIAAIATPVSERSPKQLERYRVEVHPGEYAPIPFVELDASEMARLARAAVTWQRVGKVALGDTERYGDPGSFTDAERPDVVKALTQPKDPEGALFGLLMSAARAGLLDDFEIPGEVIEVDGAERGRTDDGPYPSPDEGTAAGTP